MAICNLPPRTLWVFAIGETAMLIKLIFGAIAILVGLRMLGAAIYTFTSGKVLVRRGVKTQWVSAPPNTDFFKLLFRDVLMGILLVVLGIALIF
jgi:hypothetical protein